jgi:molybdate transport system substrate-binding protein
MKTTLHALSRAMIAVCATLLLAALAGQARAAEITFLVDGALQSAMEELIPEFQKKSGHTVKATYASPNSNTERVRKGEVADVAIVSAEQWESLQKEGKLGPAARVIIARTGIAFLVKTGAKKPDLSSVDAIKRALLGASSIAVSDTAQSPVGRHVASLLDRMGIAGEVKPKLKIAATGIEAMELVAKGEAALGLAETMDIMATADVEAAGPLPPDMQSYTTFAAAIPASANQVAAKDLVDFLLSPPAVKVLKAMGLECGITEANIDQPFSCFLGAPGEGLQIMTRGLRPPPKK